MRRAALLGCGYVGRYLIGELEARGWEVFPTSRRPGSRSWHRHNGLLHFDFDQQDSWGSLPPEAELVWLFPAEPAAQVERFLSSVSNPVRVVLGTTSSYLRRSGIVSESEPLNSERERVRGEAQLREAGANLLQCAGIYGPERHPFHWLERGLIKNSLKTVNLIHVRDLCRIVAVLLEGLLQGEQINVADGRRYLWRDVWQQGREQGRLAAPCPPAGDPEERLISNARLIELLGSDWEFEPLSADG